MSYDVRIGTETFNYTSNVSALFYDHIEGGLPSLDGLTGKQAVEKLSAAFDAIDKSRHDLWEDGVRGDPEFCALYDAENGWGSALGAILFAAQIMAACACNPRKALRVST